MIKSIIKIGFRFILSLSLIFVPSYGYSNPNSSNGSNGSSSDGPNTSNGSNDESNTSNTVETIINRLEAEYRSTQRELPPEFQEASHILTEMGTALTENRLREYIDSQPGLKSKFDVLSLSNQKVEVLDYDGKTTKVIYFDNENDNSRSYTRILKNIDVEFNNPEKDPKEKLVFKGVVVSEDTKNKLKKRIGLVHTFNDIEKKDVVDWVYDKEFLVVLHKKRGLVLYHMMFASTLLGSTPIPSINLPATDLLNLKNVKLEFIDRAVAPSVRDAHNSDMAVNLDGKPMFSAGDLLVSYYNAEGEKSIARILSRSKDLINAAFKMYVALDSLIQIREFKDNNDQSNSPYLERFLTKMIQTILSATVNRSPVSFFNKFSDLITVMPYFLVYKYIDKNPDSFLHTEWFTDYQRIRESSPDIFDQRSKEEGKTISSASIAEALQPFVASKKEEQKNKFRRMLNKFTQKHPKSAGFLKDHGFDLLVALGGLLLAGYQSYRIPYIGGSVSYFSNTVYDIVFLGAGFLLILTVLGKISIPFLKVVKNLLPSGELKLSVEQAIEKWGGDNILVKDKLTAFGFKVAALLLPMFYRVFQIFGQHHLFSTFTQGINPLKKITPDSSIGRAVGIDRSMLLGLGLPRWRSNRKNYERKSQLIDLVAEQKKKVDILSRMMTHYALSNQAFDITAVLTGPLALSNDFDYTDKKQIRNFNWVSHKLSKYILKSKRIDTTRPIFEWDTVTIHNDFFQKALNLAQEVKSISEARKQIHALKKTTSKGWQRSLAWNTEVSKVLMSYYPERAVSDQFWKGLILDHITFVILPLTSLTPRGDSYSGNLTGVAIESHTLFRSNPPHLHETVHNVTVHDVASARQQLQFLNLKKYEKLRVLFQELESLYKPIEEHLNITENTPRPDQYLLDLLKWPGQWGQKIYEGKDLVEERVDMGSQMWKAFRLTARFWVVTLTLGVLSREFFTPSFSLSSNIIGMLYFASAGFIMYGFPQVWVLMHNLIFNKKNKETKEIIDRVKLTGRKIERRLYTSSDSLNEDYKTALYRFKKLYYSSKQSQKAISLDQIEPRIKEFVLQADFEEALLREFIQSQTIEAKGEQIRIISSLLATRHLPTKDSTFGFQMALLLSLGVFSNLAFVYVSEKSFSEAATVYNTLWWLGITSIGLYTFNLFSSESISDRRKYLFNLQKDIRTKVKGMGASIKNKCSLVFRNLKSKK